VTPIAIVILCAFLGKKMFVLGIDTSGKAGGVTLAQTDDRSFAVIGSAAIAGGTFSAQLVPTLASLLKQHQLSPRDLAGLAAVSGPGSFTGLRVGLSAVKALAEILHKPIATVSVLEMLAHLSRENGTVVAALDAGRAEVFCGLYACNNGSAAEISERLLSESEFLSQITSREVSAVLTSDLRLAQIASAAQVKAELVGRPGSEQAARIGAGKLLAGKTVTAEALDANYLRRSDAEIFKGQR
jgi:tRNA threonylcarbamoyladenosine biosynthesis protein TsaB